MKLLFTILAIAALSFTACQRGEEPAEEAGEAVESPSEAVQPAPMPMPAPEPAPAPAE